MILASLAAILVLAVLGPTIARYAKPALGPLAAATLAAIGVAFIGQYWQAAVVDQQTVIVAQSWVDALDVSLSFRVDGLSMTFTLLICFIGALVMLYAGAYMAKHERAGVFFMTLLGFAASMLGLVLAENLIMIFVFWELTSITSYMLIGFDYHRESARRSAQQSLIITGVGGLVLLAGLIVLGVAGGGYEVADILNASLADHPWFGLAAVLVLVGCFSKSAIFPFHFWLPNAMEAPSPVSALLHSSTMVKAGVYLIARLTPAMGGEAIWDDTLIAFGGLTMVYAAFLSTRQTGLKKILAYSTVSSLGILVMLIGLGETEAAAAYLIAHALFKGCLFLVAGTLIKKTGVKTPTRLGGLRHTMPMTSIAGRLGALSLAGVPPFMGFVGKELLLKAGLHGEAWTFPVLVAIMATAIFTVYAAFLVGFRPFYGRRPNHIDSARDPGLAMTAGPMLLAVLGLLGGLIPALYFEPLAHATAHVTNPAYELAPAVAHLGDAHTAEAHAATHAADHAANLGGHAAGHSLSALGMLTHPSLALFLSVGAIIGGVLLWRGRAVYLPIARRLTVPRPYTADKLFDRSITGMLSFAELQTKILQNGSLRWYIRVTLAGATALIAAGIFYADLPPLPSPAMTGAALIDWMLALIIIVSAVGAVFQRKALSAIAVLGTVGFVGALVFLIYGAPDVAMTQLATETLIVIIFVLVIYHLPQFSSLTSIRSKTTDAVIAAGVGIVMAVLTMVSAVTVPGGPLISEVHAAESYDIAHGRNVINVILVDFRAFDTLGEIFVLGAAAVGLFTLLRAKPGRGRIAS